MLLYSVRFCVVNVGDSPPDPDPLERGRPCGHCRGTDTFVYVDPDPSEPPELVCMTCVKASFSPGRPAAGPTIASADPIIVRIDNRTADRLARRPRTGRGRVR